MKSIKEKYTLIIIDMQPDFQASKSRGLRGNIKNELRKAIQNDCDVIFVEFDNHFSKTYSSLTKIVRNKNNVFFVSKEKISGGQSIANVVNLNGLSKTFRISGVQTECCVMSTVTDLSKLFPGSKIEVIQNCCASFVSPLNHRVNDSAEDLHSKALAIMNKITNVTVV